MRPHVSTVGLVPGLQGPVQRVLSCACKLHHVLCFLLCQILGVRFYVEILDPSGTESWEEGGRTIYFHSCTTSLTGSVCWRRCLFSSMWLWSYNACVALGLSRAYLGFQFHSTGQCVSFLQNYAVFTITALQSNLKSEMVIPPATFLFLKIVLVIMCLLWFHMNCSPPPVSVKNDIGILMGIRLNL